MLMMKGCAQNAGILVVLACLKGLVRDTDAEVATVSAKGARGGAVATRIKECAL